MAGELGLAGGSAQITLKGHAARLGLECAHLEPGLTTRPTPTRPSFGGDPSPEHLRRAGALLAAAWFTLRGLDVSWPLEPCRYDLLVSVEGSVWRIQVKTTTARSGGSWRASLTRGGLSYDPDEIDRFFVIDGEFRCYLIPVAEVGGLRAIHLSAYGAYRVGDLQPRTGS
ncbi:MAG: group I intron-associated PD-(D/E)XK endonuclease [Sporichthyaceae bacterium]